MSDTTFSSSSLHQPQLKPYKITYHFEEKMSLLRFAVKLLKDVAKMSETHVKEVQKYVKTTIEKLKWRVTPEKLEKRKTVGKQC